MQKKIVENSNSLTIFKKVYFSESKKFCRGREDFLSKIMTFFSSLFRTHEGHLCYLNYIHLEIFYMIPKTIHYCWFGRNPLPEMALNCIASWKKYLPDYEIKEWNEDNFNINQWPYAKEAYEAKKFAFVSDIARLYALTTEGGVYMDTDVEVLKPLDKFLEHKAFSGFESEKFMPTGIMACEANFGLFKEFLDDYTDEHFILENGVYNTTTNTKRMTDICLKKGLVLNNRKQNIEGFVLYPNDFFCPKDGATQKVNLTENSFTIHHFDGSWLTPQQKWSNKFGLYLGKNMPKYFADRIAIIVGAYKFEGTNGVKNLFSRKIKKLFNS